MNKTIESIRSIKGGYINLSTTKKFANIYSRLDGFRIELTDKPKEALITLKATTGCKFKIPLRIINAYKLEDKAIVERLSENKYFVHGNCRIGRSLKPIPGYKIKDNQPLPNIDEAVVSYEHPVLADRILLKDGLWEEGLKKITLHMGNQKFVEVSIATEEDIKNFLPLKDVQKEFGNYFQNYVGNTITYLKKRYEAFA